jgi:hypothetical protein
VHKVYRRSGRRPPSEHAPIGFANILTVLVFAAQEIEAHPEVVMFRSKRLRHGYNEVIVLAAANGDISRTERRSGIRQAERRGSIRRSTLRKKDLS